MKVVTHFSINVVKQSSITPPFAIYFAKVVSAITFKDCYEDICILHHMIGKIFNLKLNSNHIHKQPLLC